MRILWSTNVRSLYHKGNSCTLPYDFPFIIVKFTKYQMLSTWICSLSTTSRFLLFLKIISTSKLCQKFQNRPQEKKSLLQGHIFNIYHPSKTFREELEMALENCFQLSSVCTTRASVLQSYHRFFSAEKIHLPTFRGLNNCKPNLSFTSSSSSFAHSFTGRCQKSRLICKAREAVDAGMQLFC